VIGNQLGSGIGTTTALATDATQLAFANQSGAIHISDTGAVKLTSVATLAGSSIPGDITSSTVTARVHRDDQKDRGARQGRGAGCAGCAS
jgi:hypothetical protein